MFKKFLPHRESGLLKKLGFWAMASCIGLMGLGIIGFAGIFAVLSIGLPTVTNLEYLTADQSTQLFDKDGKLMYTIHGDENREQIKISNVSKDLINATISIEDDDFWDHGGFNIFAIGKALMYEVFSIGTPRGGSTITQQYIKNTFLSSERSYTRKAKELILAIRLERAFNKEQILELYLNRIPYGNNAYGIEKAAQVYFGKPAKELTLAQSTLLASLPQAPTRYNPFGPNKYSHLLKEFTEDELHYRQIKAESDLEQDEYSRGLIGKHIDLGNGESVYIAGRSDLVLKRMYELGFITKDQRQKALDETQKITFNEYRENIKHPHFVLYIKEILEEKYGKDVVERGGLKVYTTLDGELQDYAEQTAEEKGEYNDKTYGTNNMAILAINPKSGHILAMVGSRDYFNEEIDGNVNVVLRPRQPGSSFKPIVYSQAFYNGFGPGSVIYDIPTKMGNDRPQNYDGKWQGQITIRRALAQSRNIPAIKAYFLAGEQDNVINLSEKMGISTLNKSHSYGYPLALGAGEIPLMEMVRAYSVFANNGKKPEITGILKVENSNGDILEEWKQEEFEEVLDPQIAYLITSILSDKEQAVGTKLFVNGHINAAKTGTSTKENKKAAQGKQVSPSDGWTLGYTPSVVVGVWAGNTDGTGLKLNADGYNIATPTFQAVLAKALAKLPPEQFPEPEGIQRVKVSKASGKLPGPGTPSSMIIEELFASFAVPTEVESIFFKVKLDKVSGLLATEFTPADAVVEVTYQNYEPEADLLNWAQEIKDFFGKNSEQNLGSEDQGAVRIGLPPTEYDNIHTAQTAQNIPVIKISSPSSQSSISQGNLKVEISLTAPNGIQSVEYYMDDEKKFFTTTAPYTGFINITSFIKEGSEHVIVAKVIDKLGYSSQSAIQVKVAKESEPKSEPKPEGDNSDSSKPKND